jgi:hypothetical protein
MYTFTTLLCLLVTIVISYLLLLHCCLMYGTCYLQHTFALTAKHNDFFITGNEVGEEA